MQLFVAVIAVLSAVSNFSDLPEECAWPLRLATDHHAGQFTDI
ncbi:hypothetical protein P3T16_000120 [Paraburkholderia sp. GAS42]|jgi:hypothetical protein